MGLRMGEITDDDVNVGTYTRRHEKAGDAYGGVEERVSCDASASYDNTGTKPL
jgi:hypothetical protein